MNKLQITSDLLNLFDSVLSTHRSFVMQSKINIETNADYMRDAINLSELCISINLAIKKFTLSDHKNICSQLNTIDHLLSELQFLIHHEPVVKKYRIDPIINRMVDLLNTAKKKLNNFFK